MNSEMQTAPSSIEPVVVSGQNKGIWSILGGVFLSPTQAMESFVRKPNVWIPLIVMIVFSILVAYYMAPYQAQIQIEMLSKSATIPQEILEQQRAEAQNVGLAQVAIMGTIMVCVITLISAVIAWGLGRLITGTKGGFLTVWGIELLSGLILTLGQLLKIPLVLAKDSAHVSYGLAAVYPNKDFTSILYSLLSYFDLFAIWAAIVAGIGYSILFQTSRGKGYAISFLTYGIFVVISISLTMGGMMLAGVDMSFF